MCQSVCAVMREMARSTEDDDDAVRLGERLRSWRKAAGLSQEQAAVLLDCTMITVQRWERGEADPGPRELRRLAELYGRDVRDVLADTDDKPPDFRGVPPFYLVVHPSTPIDPAARAEIEKAIAEANQKAVRRALKSAPKTDRGPAHPQKPG